MTGRTLAIGDIHGCDVALETLLVNLRPTTEDTVIVLGDVVDRGPNTRHAIDLLLALQETCNLKFILGNHEEMMLDSLQRNDLLFWLRYGGQDTLLSYGVSIDDILPHHLEFLQAGLPYYETDSHIFVHAFIEKDVPLAEQSDEWLRWYRIEEGEERPSSEKCVICGHSSQQSGRPLILDGSVCIDTWAYGEGSLSCLDVGADLLYQATQAGEFRDGVSLAEFHKPAS